jgi:hypothetical protein
LSSGTDSTCAIESALNAWRVGGRAAAAAPLADDERLVEHFVASAGAVLGEPDCAAEVERSAGVVHAPSRVRRNSYPGMCVTGGEWRAVT